MSFAAEHPEPRPLRLMPWHLLGLAVGLTLIVIGLLA